MRSPIRGRDAPLDYVPGNMTPARSFGHGGCVATVGLVAAATPAFAAGSPVRLVFSTQPAGATSGKALTA